MSSDERQCLKDYHGNDGRQSDLLDKENDPNALIASSASYQSIYSDEDTENDPNALNASFALHQSIYSDEDDASMSTNSEVSYEEYTDDEHDCSDFDDDDYKYSDDEHGCSDCDDDDYNDDDEHDDEDEDDEVYGEVVEEYVNDTFTSSNINFDNGSNASLERNPSPQTNESDVEESHNNTTDERNPRQYWYDDLEVPPKITQETKDQAARLTPQFLEMWRKACEGKELESDITSHHHIMGLSRTLGKSPLEFMTSEAVKDHLPMILGCMLGPFLKIVFDPDFHMRDFTPTILEQIYKDSGTDLAGCEEGASIYGRLIIHTKKDWQEIYDKTEEDFLIIEEAIRRGDMYTESEAEDLTRHIAKVRSLMHASRPYIDQLPRDDSWFVLPYVGMTEKQTFPKR